MVQMQQGKEMTESEGEARSASAEAKHKESGSNTVKVHWVIVLSSSGD
jgi:hypothetical protein